MMWFGVRSVVLVFVGQVLSASFKSNDQMIRDEEVPAIAKAGDQHKQEAGKPELLRSKNDNSYNPPVHGGEDEGTSFLRRSPKENDPNNPPVNGGDDEGISYHKAKKRPMINGLMKRAPGIKYDPMYEMSESPDQMIRDEEVPAIAKAGDQHKQEAGKPELLRSKNDNSYNPPVNGGEDEGTSFLRRSPKEKGLFKRVPDIKYDSTHKVIESSDSLADGGKTGPIIKGVGKEALQPEVKAVKQQLLSDEKNDPNNPPVNGGDDEGISYHKAKRRPMINGLMKRAPGIKYDPMYEMSESLGSYEWSKYSSDTMWCTHSGRHLIYSNTNAPITAAECQSKCLQRNPNCGAVEFWEAYNWACFECTDTTKITAYTNENDLAYPVYVWIRGLPLTPPWKKHSPQTEWCTVSGRDLIYSNTNAPITAAECQSKCVQRNPKCGAVEFWEAYNWACFECTDRSKITAYTNENDLAFPVYVWIRGY